MRGPWCVSCVRTCGAHWQNLTRHFHRKWREVFSALSSSPCDAGHLDTRTWSWQHYRGMCLRGNRTKREKNQNREEWREEKKMAVIKKSFEWLRLKLLNHTRVYVVSENKICATRECRTFCHLSRERALANLKNLGLLCSKESVRKGLSPCTEVPTES